MSTEDRLNLRNEKFKNPLNLDSLRKKRDTHAVELRKKKRTEQTAKKRALASQSGVVSAETDGTVAGPAYFPPDLAPESLSQLYPALFTHSSSARFSVLQRALLDENPSEVLFTLLSTLRKVISSLQMPPLESLLDSGVCSRLLSFLSHECAEIQTEAVWCVVNIASGPPAYGQFLINSGVLGKLLPLLDSEAADLIEQAAWALGNLAGDSVESRDLLISRGAPLKILAVLAAGTRLSLQHKSTLIWVLGNFLRGKPSPPPELAHQILSQIPGWLQLPHEEIAADCLWIASYISDGNLQGISELIALGLVPVVIQLASPLQGKVLVPALRTLGNIVSGTEAHTECALGLGALDSLSGLLAHNKKSSKKEALWALSNILAGTQEQIENTMAHPCFTFIVAAISDPDLEIQKEAIWCLANVASCKTSPALPLKLVELGAFEPLCRVLELQDARLLFLALDALNNILRAGRDYLTVDKQSGLNELLVRFSEIGGVSSLEELQCHRNVSIYEKVVSIMEEHFGIDEVQDENGVLNAPYFNLT